MNNETEEISIAMKVKERKRMKSMKIVHLFLSIFSCFRDKYEETRMNETFTYIVLMIKNVDH